MEKSISDEEIKQLWQDPNFPGSFQSAQIFQTDLELNKKIHVNLHRLYKVLSQIREFHTSIRPIKHFDRRNYSDVHGFFILVHIDLAKFEKVNGLEYVLSCVDVYSHRIFISLLKNKTATEVVKGMEKIFKEFGYPQEVQTDRGTEFTSAPTQNYFKKHNIYFHDKIGPHKASYSEWSFFRIKKGLYNLMRNKDDYNWPKYIVKMVENINSTPSKSLQGKRPIDFSSNLDDPLLSPKPTSSYQSRRKRSNDYFKKKDSIKVGDFVTLDDYIFDKYAFTKSYKEQVIAKHIENSSPSEKCV